MLDCLLTTLIRELQCDTIEGRRAEARRVAARFVRSVARIYVVLNAEMTPQSGKKRLLVLLQLCDLFAWQKYIFCLFDIIYFLQLHIIVIHLNSPQTYLS